MTELHWQVAFLLAAAFFFGGVVACGLKRKFYYRRSTHTDHTPAAVAPAVTEPKIEVEPSGQADSGSERFGSALAGGASVASSTPVPEPVSEPMPAKAAAPQATLEETKLVFPPMVQRWSRQNQSPNPLLRHRVQSQCQPLSLPWQHRHLIWIRHPRRNLIRRPHSRQSLSPRRRRIVRRRHVIFPICAPCDRRPYVVKRHRSRLEPSTI